MLQWLLSAAAAAAVESDLVTELPGANFPLPVMHSGYQDIDCQYLDASGEEECKKHLHYVFVECDAGVSSCPVILWLNG